jgi:hypothetical protein
MPPASVLTKWQTHVFSRALPRNPVVLDQPTGFAGPHP